MKKEETNFTDNSFGVASVVLGIMGVILSSLPGIIIGIIGLTFALKQYKISKNSWAKAGIILNIVGIILGKVIFILALNSLFNNPDFLAQIQSQIENA